MKKIFFYIYFLIVGLLHLVIDHYCEEEDFFFLSLFILGFFYLIIVARWGKICKNQIIRIFDDNNFFDFSGIFIIVIRVDKGSIFLEYFLNWVTPPPLSLHLGIKM